MCPLSRTMESDRADTGTNKERPKAALSPGPVSLHGAVSPACRRRAGRTCAAPRDTSSSSPLSRRRPRRSPSLALTGKRRLGRAPRYQVETASTRFVELCVSSNVCARFRYLLRAATSAIRAGRPCCAIGFWKSRLLHSMPSSRQSCFAFSMISSTVGSDIINPRARSSRTA